MPSDHLPGSKRVGGGGSRPRVRYHHTPVDANADQIDSYVTSSAATPAAGRDAGVGRNLITTDQRFNPPRRVEGTNFGRV